MLRKFLIALSLLALPSLAEAADITGTAKVRAGDAVVIAVPSGVDTIAAIQVSAAGVVQVSPLENS